MPLLLSSHPWRISYSSNENNPIADFYIPALERSIRYDRRSGYFNSAILSKVARGLGAMLENEGKTRLIMGCQFSPEDIQAIRQGYELREALAARLDIELQPPANFAQLKHLEILSWLVANGYLDIKIAVPLKDDGSPFLGNEIIDTRHIFHDKAGIFTDERGDRLAFNGSNNESIAGWENNIESFHVYCSWEGDRELERVNEEEYRFETLWNDLATGVKVFDVPEAVKRKLLRYTPATRPTWNERIEFDNRPLPIAVPPETPDNPNCLQQRFAPVERETEDPLPTPAVDDGVFEREREVLAPLLSLHEHPGCLDYCLKSIPIQPWPHQLKILRRVADGFPRDYAICDEVGLGKTIETGLLLRYLIVSKKVRRVLLLVPASVQSQWHEELREKFNLHFWSYNRGEFRDPNGCSYLPVDNPWNERDLILASSHLVRRSERTDELLTSASWDLVILDEAHHARRSSPTTRKDTPNRLLKLFRQLREKTRSLILLTATPMQVDTVEIYDLLSLLGLTGKWRYQDTFCHYFDVLPLPPDRGSLEFWQEMSVDYFREGGQPCSKLERYLGESDRLLLYRLKDTWNRGKPIVNPRDYLSDTKFLAASKHYLTVHTPLKDLMFRHTRDTLREYYRRGLLERDIPRREVFDQFITLEPEREIPLYQAVSDYVRHFYNLARQENRKGLGFLMTLYRRRLTSSFYAIRQSLQRRLDGIGITEDDYRELDDADDAVIEGLEAYLQPTDPREIEYLEDLLRQFENTGEDSKFARFLTILRQELIGRESAIVFTQYTDTMDYLRDTLARLYGDRVACYSGRGGERYEGGEWRVVPKERIKRAFREGEIKILLCTESANEGLNLQTCGVLLNWDCPWVPARIDQRIGRIDRIGQRHDTVRIHNFYYDGTVEARIYRRLRERINIFETVVGNLQPILARVPTLIEEATMAADPEEEGVLITDFENILDTPSIRMAIDDIVEKDVETDLEEIRRPLVLSPIDPDFIERTITSSAVLRARGYRFESIGDRRWRVHRGGSEALPEAIASPGMERIHEVTFYPEVFEEYPSARLLTVGEPLLEELLQPFENQITRSP